ncbi:MAG: D-glycerate dehydrogenase [Nitrospirota bacterium]|nr:D-glycerate dehydrogenase [Nitrospirota bacterium]MDE3241540.1 D-glycerate dehydrogenase [Nitrospirota bacterium]
MAKPAIYVARLLVAPVMAAIHERFELTLEPNASPPARDTLAQGLRRAEAIIPTLTERIDATLLQEAPRLKVIANHAVGYNNIDLPAATARGIVVTNTPDVLTDATADLTWALLLAVARRITEGYRLVQTGAWTGWEPTQLLGADVSGQTLGIVGMGRIGQAVARRAMGFGMTVLYASRTSVPSPDSMAPWRQVTLETLLRQSDFISLHVPLTPDTHHLIGGKAFSLMRPAAILLNTSRGPVVDEAALAAALNDGRLAGAGLDVYEEEPKIHPGLLALPQVVTLPHLGSATLNTRVRMGVLCVENVLAVLEGRPAPNRVV